jgi:2-keto-4-pentenoate hydratase/2-oxohepta-3-ene-1,7-dioic acid hydratase in catechol pathway
MSSGVTRIIRFIGEDGKTYFGEEPPTTDTPASILVGNVFDGSLARTGESMKISKLLAPTIPTDIFCIGLNYMRHYEESAKKRGIPLPDQPVIFMKPSSTLAHPGQDIWIPRIEHGEEFDWEVELTIVIGKECRNVTKEEALDYVLGYIVGNDVSSRHWQKNAGGSQWVKGKSFDTFCPLGPVLVTTKEIPDPQKLRVITRVNGVIQQDSLTEDMIFTCAQCIEWLSNNMTLLPGAVILTGTPAGVATGRCPPNWLKVGDVVECEVPGIGVLRNTVAMAPERNVRQRVQ